MNKSIICLIIISQSLLYCTIDRSIRYNNSQNRNRSTQVSSIDYIFGISSFYADKFHGRQTANGEIFDMYALTAAHKTLPFGTLLEVENLSNNKKVVVRINDRGPFVGNRILDLSYAAALELDLIKSGTAEIRARIIR